ncbi:MAG: hypothetical protein JXP34_27270 [Planctomycetes bacterium]|nr:hypothetical protein [Planctomycetota bacterium]
MLTNARPGELMGQLRCQGHPLGKAFALRFRLLHDLEDGYGQPLWLMFNDTRKPCGFFCIPDVRHEFSFSRLDERWWATPLWRPFPPGKPVPRRWFDYEIRWDAASRRLAMTIGGRQVFDDRLDAAHDLSGPFCVGFCGGKRTSLRNAYVNERE